MSQCEALVLAPSLTTLPPRHLQENAALCQQTNNIYIYTYIKCFTDLVTYVDNELLLTNPPCPPGPQLPHV